MLEDAPARAAWSRNGLAYADHADLYSMPQRAADLILGRPRESWCWKSRSSACGAGATRSRRWRRCKARSTANWKGAAPSRTEVDGRGYFVKIHRGIGWGEIAKNLLTAKLPVLGARSGGRPSGACTRPA